MPGERRKPLDPARSLAILWRTREPVSRGPGPTLTVDRIVRAGIALADAEGLEALTMRRVSEGLGVGTMSVDTYVPGRAELVTVMIDTVYAETARPTDLPDWRARLEQVARENWALYLRHPWLVQAETNRPVLGPNLLAKYDYELSAVEVIGLTDLEMDSVLTLLLGHVKQAARAAVDQVTLERDTGLTEAQWWQAHAPWLELFAAGATHPTASRVGTAAGQAHGAAYHPGHAFEFGLHRVLDGIAVVVDGRTGAA
jgi:AcrR family transcriptional regulator